MEFFMTHRKIWKDLKALTYGKIKAKMGWHVETERWRTLNTMALVFRKRVLGPCLHGKKGLLTCEDHMTQKMTCYPGDYVYFLLPFSRHY